MNASTISTTTITNYKHTHSSVHSTVQERDAKYTANDPALSVTRDHIRDHYELRSAFQPTLTTTGEDQADGSIPPFGCGFTGMAVVRLWRTLYVREAAVIMDTSSLVACLLALPRPADAEEWLGSQAASDAVPVSDDYCRAVYDLLTALGVLKADAPEVTSPMAYYFVQSLIALLRDADREGHALSAAWQGRPSQAQAGVGARLVNLLETYRLEALAAPTPLRTISAVMSVIKGRRGTEDVYLMQFDDKAEQFQPIGGKCEAFDANNEAALLRELSEELNLPPLTLGIDLNVHPLSEHQAHQKVSATLQLITQYDHSFYHLTDVKFPLNTDSQTRWLTTAELQAGRTMDGLAISPLLSSLSLVDLALLPYSLAQEVSGA